VEYGIAIVFAYLTGSIPFGVIIARAHHQDLRTVGSGNIGATNVSRALGKRWGYICFGLDVLKGFIPTLLTLIVIKSGSLQAGLSPFIFLWLWLAVGCAAILGHIFPLYLKFKGGKGVATSFGVALGIWPYFTISAVLAIITWAGVVLKTRYISLSSMVAAIAFPLYLALTIALFRSWSFADLWPLQVIAVGIPAGVVIRHKDNVKRILAGTEHKIRS